MFPKELAQIIAGYAAKLMLLEWIDKSKLDGKMLIYNQRAVEAGLVDEKDCKYVPLVSYDYILSDDSDDEKRWCDPNWTENLKPGGDFVIFSDEWLSLNPSPQAIKEMMRNPVIIDLSKFSMNPAAVPWLREHREYIDWSTIVANPEAIDLIKEKEAPYPWDRLCENSHPWAIEQLRLNQHNIFWNIFSLNPSIFEYRADPNVIAILMKI